MMKKSLLVSLLCLLFLSGTAHADARRVQIVREAAEQGDAAAQNKLGVFYEIGASIEQSDVEAVKWFRMAAAQGHGEALYNLGEMYEAGRGVEQNIEEAISLYKKSCERGCKCGCRKYRQLTVDEEAPVVSF
ncbi:MAG: sel1 repeat family protein [Chlorobiaceae bacterium]|nr:sel1 repeat family protein [Chlorobiaceae bacterium]